MGLPKAPLWLALVGSIMDMGKLGSTMYVQGANKKRCLVILDFLGLSKHLYTQLYKSIDFYPKLWYPEAWVPVVYSISLLSCMVKYKDASKDQSSLIMLNTVFLDTLYVSQAGK